MDIHNYYYTIKYKVPGGEIQVLDFGTDSLQSAGNCPYWDMMIPIKFGEYGIDVKTVLIDYHSITQVNVELARPKKTYHFYRKK